jgi:outer membrane receptor protein involved in Fe transport
VGYQTIANSYNTKYCANGATTCQLGALQDNVNVGSNNENFSIFLTDTLDLTDKLKVTASGSFNISMVSLSGANNQYLNSDGGYSWHSDAGYTATSGNFYNPDYIGLVNPTSFISGTQNYNKTSSGTTYTYTPGPETNDLSGSHRYQRFNPAFGFSYLPVKSLNIFGGYSEAMRAPTAIELACADPAHPCTLPTGFNGDPHLNAVVAKTYELGARGLFSTNATWNLAVYDTKLSNDIQFVQSTPNTGNFANVGSTERRGVDAGIRGKHEKLFLAANYGYVDAKYRSSWTTTGDQDVVNGNKIPGIANQTLKLRAVYEVSPQLMVGSNLILVAGQYAHGDEANQSPKVPGYGVMNLDIHYKVSDDLTLNGVVNNLLDKQYYTYGVRGANIYTNQVGTFMTPAASRSVWLGLTYTFGGKRLNKIDKD